MKTQKDLYDRLIELKVFRNITPLKKFKEPILYVFFGGLTFLVSICSYSLCYYLLEINELISNIISWILAVTFAYFTNRKYVFESVNNSLSGRIKEIGSFFAARLATLIIEELIIFVFITLLEYNSLLVKTAAQVIVIVSNYFLSKFWIFKGKNSRNSTTSSGGGMNCNNTQ